MAASDNPLIDRLRPVVWRAVLLVFIGGPMAWASAYALAYSLGGVGRLSTGWTLAHWHVALAEPRIIGAMLYSLAIASCVTTLVILLAFGLLLGFPQLRNKRPFLLIIAIMMGTPSLVLAQMVANIIGPGGWLSRLCFHAGLINSAGDFPPLINDIFSVGVILSSSLSLLPLALLYFSQLWSRLQIDRCCQLAQSLGASWLDTRWRVAVPMLWSRGRSMTMLLFIWTLGSYEIPLLLGRQSPQMFSVATRDLTLGFDLSHKPLGYVLALLYLGFTSLMVALAVHGRKLRE